ncbi:MAG: PEGA domain-containing protein [Myxococcales bacterium]|nr:PEGA domain-containing protein [Myxococcales bacterium]MCB9609527.1 PEGA domain-containing protein [Polyangiaceae bacterium]
MSFALAVPELGAQDARTEARERFDRGLRLTDQGDVEGALAEFQRAYALVPHPRVLYNIGLVQASAGRMVEAFDALETVLKDPTGLGPEQLEHARSMRERVLARIAYIRVEVNADDAEVELAGESHKLTSKPLRVTSGRHFLTVSAPGRGAQRVSLSVAGGETRVVKVTLEAHQAAQALLRVNCTLPDAEVRVDGAVLGETPLPAPLSVQPGNHVVELTREGYVAVRRKIAFGSAVAAELDACPRVDTRALRRSGGRLDVRVREDNAVIWVDDEVIQSTSLVVPPGKHRLRVERAGFVSFEREVDVPRGGYRVDVELIPDASYRRDYRDAALSQRTWGWVGVGGGAAIGVGAVAFLLWNRGQQQDAQRTFNQEAPRHESSGDCWPGLSDLADDCKDLNTLVDDIEAANGRFGYGWAALGLGVVAAGVGSYLLIAGDDPDRFEPGADSEFLVSFGLTPMPMMGGVGLGLKARNW